MEHESGSEVWHALRNWHDARISRRHRSGITARSSCGINRRTRWVTGWFDDLTRLIRQVDRLRDRGNLYTSLNGTEAAPRRQHHDRRADQERRCRMEYAIAVRLRSHSTDRRYRRPPTSCKPRMQGVTHSSDAAQTGMADAAAWSIRQRLSRRLSCRLPSNDETTDMFRSIYSGLAAEFGDDEVGFDRSVKNPGRIFRLYGTRNRKGPDTAERPHRMSTCWIPDPWRQVDRRRIEDLANYYARQSETAPSRKQARRAIRGFRQGRLLDSRRDRLVHCSRALQASPSTIDDSFGLVSVA
jgi:hypothetical protein